MLWRWSTAVQVSSLATIAVFFIVLARSVRTGELRFWVLAWIANFAALVVTVAFWYVAPPAFLNPLVRALYMGAKTAFVLFLMRGAWALKRPGTRLVAPATFVPAFLLYLLVAAFALETVTEVGVVQHVTMGVLLALGALLLGRGRGTGEHNLTWLRAGFVLRSLLAFVESATYATALAPGMLTDERLRQFAGTFMASHSAFDSGIEWFLALGCVLALSERAQRELHRYNRDLLAAQEDLRKIADRDPLTSLANRRSLPDALSAVSSYGATLLFFDLDEFKLINDLYGHQVGDECLKRFAAALSECFRPEDGLFRYAGDEFLVVARGLDVGSAEERVGKVRERLRSKQGPPIAFSVGVSTLAPGGDGEEAVKAADEAMYRAKESRLSGRELLVRLPRVV
jgi:diguanylate cyclase (GGDEF)-like protein